MKRIIIAAMPFLAACATAPATGGFVRVTPSQLAADATAWDGRAVQVSGFLTWEFEDYGLYDSREAYCEGADAAAINVDWDEWPGVTKADNHRLVTVRGTFRNLANVKQPDGHILITNAAPGPGPLEPGSILRWDSPPLGPC